MSNITQFPIPALTISQISSLASAALTDIIIADQTGVTGTETLQQVLNLFLPNLFLTYAGNPNGNLAGTQNQVCWDSTDQILYVCITTGTALSAIWRPCIGQLTDGQLRIGSTGNAPVAASLIAGTGVTIIPGPGTITINASASGISWNNITTSSATMIADNGYICNNASGVTLALPTTSNIGDILYIVGRQSGWTISQAASQQIFVSINNTTIGSGGALSSTNAHDSILLVCTATNTEWTAISQQSAGLTIV